MCNNDPLNALWNCDMSAGPPVLNSGLDCTRWLAGTTVASQRTATGRRENPTRTMCASATNTPPADSGTQNATTTIDTSARKPLVRNTGLFLTAAYCDWAKDIPLFPGFLFFLCSLTRCLTPAPLKLLPYVAIQICLLLFFTPVLREWKNYAMQYKKVQKSSCNETYSSSSFTKQPCSKMDCTAESERRGTEIKKRFLCRRPTDQQACDRV